MSWNRFRSRRTSKLPSAPTRTRRSPLALEPLEDRRLPATFTWVQNAGGDFNNAANWRDENNNPGVPGANDDAVINTTGINVTSSTSNTVNSLLCGAQLTLLGGTFSIADAGKNSHINTLVQNAGTTLQANAGTLFVSGGSSSGTLVAASGAMITFGNDQFSMNAGSSLTGAGLFFVGGGMLTLNVDENAPANFQVDGGAVNGPGILTITNTFTWSGGNLDGPSTTIVPVGTTLNITSFNFKYLTGGHVLNIAGTATWTGTGELDGSPGSTLNNSGIFNVQTDVVSGSGGAGAGVVFNNSGVFTKSGTTGTTAFQGNVFNNSGTVNVQSGTLSFDTNYTQTAGTTVVAAGATLASSGSVNIQGGSLTGSGTLNADVSNSGTISTGSATGTLTITRGFTQTAGGSLNVKIAGTSQFDTITVGGTATLGGTLTVSLANGFTPSAGQAFKILTFASSSGGFATLNGLSISPSLSFDPVSGPTDITLVVSAPSPGVLQFTSGSFLATVTSGSATLTVSRTSGSTGTVSVQYATSNGTAQAGVRYVATSGTLTFGPGVTTQSFTIPLLNPSTVHGNQTVNITLSNATGGAVLGTPASAVLTIVDNNVGDDIAFVSGLYHDVLGRAADAGGLANWQQIIDASRNPVHFQFALSYVASTENRSHFVTGVYTKYLGRTPSPTEVAGWVGVIQQGQTPEQIIAAFVGSPEYFQKQGGTNSGWLDRVYQDVFGRARDPGSQGFLDQLNAGASRAAIAIALLGSTEYRSDVIAQVYTTYLLRQPGAADLQAWLPLLGQPSSGAGQPSPDEQFLASVLGSAEYFQTIGNTELTWTTSLYTKLLGRTPSSAELTNLLVGVLNGYAGTRQTIALAFTTSVEAETAAVAGYYAQLLGRTGSPGELSLWVNQIVGGKSREQVIAAIASSPEYFQRQGGTITAFVDRLYVDLLGRQRSASETGFIDALTTGRVTPLQVTTALLQSTEYAQRVVNGFYSTALGRQAGTAESSGWVQSLLQGTRDEQVLATILSSPEYFERAHPYP